MAGTPSRTLVIDESLDTRLATELGHRGRSAVSVAALHLRGRSDLDLLRGLDAQLSSWVLVTADDGLPEGRADALEALGGAVATVDPAHPSGWLPEDYRREVVHRWAHLMHAQAGDTAWRYGLTRHQAWRPRRRRPRGTSR